MTPSANCVRWRHKEFRSIGCAVSADILRFLNKSPENQASGDTFKSRTSALLTPQLLSLLAYRIAHYLHVHGWRRAAAALVRFNMIAHKVNLPADSCIGPGCFLPHPAGVSFYGSAGRGLTLYSLAMCLPALAPLSGVARLGDEITVGAHSSLAGALEVGDRTKIAFAVPLRRSAPAGVMVLAPEAWANDGPRRPMEREVAV
jgi:serine acetyltransferase